MASYGKGSFDSRSSYQDSGTGGVPDRAQLVQTVGNNIQKISSNETIASGGEVEEIKLIAQLDKLVKQIGTPQDSEQLRDKVHNITHSTNQLAKDTNRDMQALAKLPVPADVHLAKQQKTQKERLTEKFSDELKNFQTIQRTAAEKERASITRARAASSSNYSQQPGPLIDFGSGFGDESHDEKQFSTPGYSATAQVLQMENDVDLESIRERESAIKQLESDIMDVNQIFKDLGMLVHEQGEVLDSIEANVEHAQIHVEEGTKQLSSAREYQSKARRKKCCLIVVLLIILAIIAIIIAVTVSNNK